MKSRGGSGPSVKVAGMGVKRTMSLARRVDSQMAGLNCSQEADKALVEAALKSGVPITRIEKVGKSGIKARRPRQL